LDGAFSHRFQHPLAAKLCGEFDKFCKCKNGTNLLYHHAKYGGTRTLHAARGPKSLMFFLSCQDSLVCLIFPIYAPHMRPVHPLFLIFPLVHSLPHLLLFFTFSLFPFLIRFTCFLLLSIPSLFFCQSSPTPFPGRGHRRRPNLGLVCCVYFTLSVLLSYGS